MSNVEQDVKQASQIKEGTHRWVAIFEDKKALDATLEALNHAGFDHHELSLLVKHQPEENGSWSHFNAAAVPVAPPGGPVFVDTKWAEHWTEAGAAPNAFDKGDPQAATHDSAHAEPESVGAEMQAHHDVDVRSADALKTNTLAGAIMGMVAGAAATLIPGVGPVLGVGAMAAGLGALSAGAAVGGAAGGLLGFFRDKGLPAEHAEIYAEALNDGKLLLFVEAHYEESGPERNRLAAAEHILAAHVPEAIYQEK